MTSGIITICVIDEPFIHHINGKFTTDALKEIEDQYIEDFKTGDIEIDYNVLDIVYECTWCKEQVGEYGRVEIPGYWDLTEISKIIIE